MATQICFIFIPTWGRSHFDDHIFQMGWFNHQLVSFWWGFRIFGEFCKQNCCGWILLVGVWKKNCSNKWIQILIYRYIYIYIVYVVCAWSLICTLIVVRTAGVFEPIDYQKKTFHRGKTHQKKTENLCWRASGMWHVLEDNGFNMLVQLMLVQFIALVTPKGSEQWGNPIPKMAETFR